MTAAFSFASTRDPSVRMGFSAALLQGLAPDGGLYVPSAWPRLPLESFEGAVSLPEVATRIFIGRPGSRGSRRRQAARKRAPKSLNAAVGP